MFGLRRRWPLLTAGGAALLYVVNNYRLTGLEHLHLQPIHSATAVPAQPAAAPADAGWPGGFDLTQFGIHTAPVSSPASPLAPLDVFGLQSQAAPPAWNQQLSPGEKLALWQAQLSQDGASPAAVTGSQSSFPSTSPIPTPPGFAPPTAAHRSPPLAGLPTASHAAVGIPGEGDPQPSLGSLLPLNAAAPAVPLAQAGDAIPAGRMTSLDQPPRAVAPSTPASPSASTATLRVASFKVADLETTLLAKPEVVQLLVAILQQYELVALQGVHTNRDDVLPLLIEKLNSSGRRYDYLIGPRVGRTAPRQQFAFVFDTSRLETDRYQLYSVDDPEDLLNYEPLVAWVRCRGVPASQAFTFSMINVGIDPRFAAAEQAMLPGLVDAVQRDGRQEDDWILAGDVTGGSGHLSVFDRRQVRLAVSDTPTDVLGTQMLDTLIFSSRATTEFTGRAGVFDFLRKHNLSIERALEISERMPVWAEFSCMEGAQPGRVAPAWGT